MKILFILTLLIFLTNCRKEIDTVPSTTIETTNTSTFVKPWRKISFPTFMKARCFEIYNDELYIAASENISGFGENHYLYKLGGVDYSEYTYPDNYNGKWDYIQQVFEFNNYLNPQGVFSMKSINGKLYLGGDFRFGNDDYDLICMDNTNNVQTVSFSNTSASVGVINHIGEYNGNVVVCGNFTSTTSTLFQTDFIELIQNNVAVGMADLSGVTHDSQVFQNELYVVGELDQIVKWNGSSWDEVYYPGKTATDRVYSVEIFDSELYFLGDFAGNKVLKKYSPSNGWKEFTSITNLNIPTYSELRVLEDELFIVGRYFISNNTEGSIWKYEGEDNWRKFGQLKNQVRDIIKFKSKFYAVAEDGIYLY